MSNPNKAQGTYWEQAIIAAAKDAGLAAWPLARRGPSDPGDLAIQSARGPIVVEARCRDRMSVHTELEAAKQQTRDAVLPFVPYSVVLVWKRLSQKPGNERRSRVGEPLGVQGLDDWLGLL